MQSWKLHKSNLMLFTTSWDDGYALDMKLAEMLERYGATGTFYVCPLSQHGHRMLSETEIRLLANRHEVGAHSLTHPHLTELSPHLCKQEIEGSKEWIEDITKKECAMFCYPYGDQDENVRMLTRRGGFRGARTTEGLRFSTGNAFSLPVTLQVSPFPERRTWSRGWHILDPFGPLRVKFMKLRKLKVPFRAMRSWLGLALCLFDYAIATEQPFFHLWGHSHEIEKFHLWGDLEKFLMHVQKSGVQCVTNGALIEKSS